MFCVNIFNYIFVFIIDLIALIIVFIDIIALITVLSDLIALNLA